MSGKFTTRYSTALLAALPGKAIFVGRIVLENLVSSVTIFVVISPEVSVEVNFLHILRKVSWCYNKRPTDVPECQTQSPTLLELRSNSTLQFKHFAFRGVKSSSATAIGLSCLEHISSAQSRLRLTSSSFSDSLSTMSLVRSSLVSGLYLITSFP